MLQGVLAAQRDALIGLRNEGAISNEVMHRVVTELDLEESASSSDADRRLLASESPAPMARVTSRSGS